MRERKEYRSRVFGLRKNSRRRGEGPDSLRRQRFRASAEALEQRLLLTFVDYADLLRVPMTGEGLLHYVHSSGAGEERTGWTDVRHPAYYSGNDGPDTATDNDVRGYGYDRSDNQVLVRNVFVQAGSLTADPEIETDYDFANQVYGALGISVLNAGNHSASYSSLSYPLSDTEVDTVRAANRSGDPQIVDNYYVKSFDSVSTKGKTFDPGPATDSAVLIVETPPEQAFAHELGHFLIDDHEFGHAWHLIAGGATGGNFQLQVDGNPTAAIPFNASAATVQAALNNLTLSNTFDVVKTNSSPHQWSIDDTSLPNTPVVIQGIDVDLVPSGTAKILSTPLQDGSDAHSSFNTDLMYTPAQTVTKSSKGSGNSSPREPGLAVGSIGGKLGFQELVRNEMSGASQYNDPTAFDVPQRDAIFTTESDGNQYVQQTDHGATHGDHVDFAWVEENAVLASASSGNGDNHDLDEMTGGWMVWEIGALAPSVDDSTHEKHDWLTGRPEPELQGYTGLTFRFVDVVSQIARYADMDVDGTSNWSPRDSALDYELEFSATGNLGSWQTGTLASVFEEGWTDRSKADDFLARWYSPVDATHVRIKAKPHSGNHDGNAQIDAVIAAGAAVVVEGTKWHDVNHNAMRDDDADLNGIANDPEPGLQDWRIYLDLNQNGQFDEGEPNDHTNPGGQYIIDEIAPSIPLPPGTYTVREEAPEGWIQVAPHARERGVVDRTNLTLRDTSYTLPADISHLEPTIAVHPKNPDIMFVAAAREQSGLFYAYTDDGGQTWTKQTYSGTAAPDDLPLSNPMATFDAFGNLFLTYVNYGASGSNNGLDSGGVACTPLSSTCHPAPDEVVVAYGKLDNVGNFPLNELTRFTSTERTSSGAAKLGDVADPAITTGPGVTPDKQAVWLAYQDRGKQVDSGQNPFLVLTRAEYDKNATISSLVFQPPQEIPTSGKSNHVELATDGNGRSVIVFQNPDEERTKIRYNIFDPNTNDFVFNRSKSIDGTNAGSLQPAALPDRSVDAAPGVVIDRSGGFHDGRVYVVYTERNTDFDTEVVMSYSDDPDDREWSPPIRVNDDVTTNSQLLPRIALDQATGHVAIAWYDARRDDGSNDELEVFVAASIDGGQSFLPNVRVSNGSSSEARADAPTSIFQDADFGDHMGVAFANGTIHPVWADNSADTDGDANPATEPLNIYTAAVQNYHANLNITKRIGVEAEIDVAVNPTNPDNVIVAPLDKNALPNATVSISLDGGVSWIDQTIPLPAGTDTYLGDPTVTFDRYGRAVFVYLAQTGTSQRHTAAAVSTDGGFHWTASEVTAPGSNDDKPFLAVGPDKDASGNDVFYLGWHRGNDLYVARSDNGLAWTTGVQVNDGPAQKGINSQIAVGPDGELYYAWQKSSPGVPSQILLDRSLDKGQTWGTDTVVASTDIIVTGGNSAFTGTACTLDRYCIPAAPYRGASLYLSVDVDRSDGPNRGNLYVSFMDQALRDGTTASQAEHNDTNIYMMRSTTGGASFFPPIQVNNDTGSHSQFLPWLDIDQTTGNVGLIWYDARNDTNDGEPNDVDETDFDNDEVQVYAAISSDGGVTFDGNFRISQGASHAAVGGPPFFDFGEYIGLEYHDGVFYSSWADNSNALDNTVNLDPVFPMEAFVARTRVGGFDQPHAFSHVVSPDPGQTVSNLDFVNREGRSALPPRNLSFLQQLGAWFDASFNLLPQPEDAAAPIQEISHGSLDDILEFPFLENGVGDIVDFSRLFLQIDGRLNGGGAVYASTLPDLVSTFADDAHLVITVDGVLQQRIAIPATGVGLNSLNDLITALQTGLSDAGLDDILAAVESNGVLGIEISDASEAGSINIASLELIGGIGPANGRLSNDIVAGSTTNFFKVLVTRSLPDQNGVLIATTDAYEIDLEAATGGGAVFTDDNVDVSELADDLNLALLAAGLADVRAYIDFGPDGLLDVNPSGTAPIDDLLVLAASNPHINKIQVQAGGTGVELGLPNAFVDSGNSTNAALNLLGFEGEELIVESSSSSLEYNFAALEQILREMSAESGLPLPLDYAIAPQFSTDGTVATFNLRLNHQFEKPIDLDFFETGIDLGSFGVLEVAALADANWTATAQLDLELGLLLGENNDNFELTENTPLADLNGGSGVQLLVGMTATNVAPSNGKPGSDLAFAVNLDLDSGSASHVITLLQTDTDDNIDVGMLVDDINAALMAAGIGSLVQASVHTRQEEDQDGHILLTEERLLLRAIDGSVRGLSLGGPDEINLGFHANQQSDFADLLVGIGPANTSSDTDCSDNDCVVEVNLDAAFDIQGVIDAIQSATGNQVTVEPNDTGLGLILTAAADLTVFAAREPSHEIDNVDDDNLDRIEDGFRSLAGTGLGILGLPDLNLSAAENMVIEGEALNGEGLWDRIFVIPRESGDAGKDIGLRLGVEVEDVDVSAALGTLSFDLRGNDPAKDDPADPDIDFGITLGTNLQDPGLGAQDDGRIYLSEEVDSPADVLVLNPLQFDLDVDGAAHLRLGVNFDSDQDDFLKAIAGENDPLFTLDIVGNTVTKDFDVELDADFDALFAEFDDVDTDTILEVVRGVIGLLQDQQSTPLFNQEIPLLKRSLNDIVSYADGLLDAVNSVLLYVDVDAVTTAVDDLETAVWNLSSQLGDRERMLRGIEMLRRVLGNPNELDVHGNPRLPARLLSAARQMAKAIHFEVDSLPTTSQPDGTDDLIDARDALLDQVPSLNSVEKRLSNAIERALRDALGIPDSDPNVTFEFDLGVADDLDNDGDANKKDRAIVVGFRLADNALLNETFDPALPPADLFGTIEVQTDPNQAPSMLHVGGGIGMGFAYDLRPSVSNRALVLVDPPSSFDGIDLHKTELDLSIGFEGELQPELRFGQLDLLSADLELSLLRSEIAYFSTGLYDGNAGGNQPQTLNPKPVTGEDGRFVIVAIYPSNGASPTVLSHEEYTLVDMGSTMTLVVSDTVDLSVMGEMTVEYHSTATQASAVDPSDVAKRGVVNLSFDPIATPGNPLGGVPVANFFADTDEVIDAYNRNNAGVPQQGSLIVGSADATFLNNAEEDIVTVATSLQHLLQPQFNYDEEALTRLFENVEFDLKTIVLGIEAFLSTLENGLTDDVVSKLPVVGGGLNTAGTFIGDLRSTLVTPFREFLCDLNGTFDEAADDVAQFIYDQFVAIGLDSALEDLDTTPGPSPGDILVELDRDHFQIFFSLAGGDTQVIDFDSGLAGLAIDAEGQGGVEFGWNYDVDFGVGVDRFDGFYFVVDGGDPEITLDIGAELLVDGTTNPEIPTSLLVNFLGLQLSATDVNDGPNPGTSIGGMLALDAADTRPGDGLDRLYFTDVAAAPFGDIFSASMTAQVAVMLRLEAGINDTLPSVQTDLVLEWMAELTTTNGEIEVDATDLKFALEDIGVNLGDFLSRHIASAVHQINKFLEPVEPLVKFLKTEVPGISQLSQAAGKGPVTFLDLAATQIPDQAENARKFVDALDTLIQLRDNLKVVDDDTVVFILKDALEILDGSDDNQAGAVAGDAGFGMSVDVDAEVSADGGQDGDPSQESGSKIKGLIKKLEELGIQLHFLDVGTVVKMILGQQFDVISYDVPRLELPFSWEKKFRAIPFPPISIRIGLDANVFADLSVGYDSHGLDTGRFFDGFYFGDKENVFTGADIEEFGLGLGVRLAALLDLVIASAGVEGELRGDIFANWRDQNDDGKMHLDEMSAIVRSDGFGCLFDLRGELRAIVRAIWEINYLFGTETGSKEFINEIIFSFENECPKYELGHVSTGGESLPGGPQPQTQPGTLVLHAGAFAGQRRPGATSDVAEAFTVTQLAPGSFKIEALGLESRYDGINQIFFDGGKGSDQLMLVNVDVPVIALGGADDDILYATRHSDYLDGGPGDDELYARGGSDDVFGGSGKDLIYGDLAPADSDSIWGTGDGDNIDGGAGDDRIFAAEGDDVVMGGSGNDQIMTDIGTDTVYAGAGSDVVFGGGDGDMIFGDAGRDQLFGEGGDDHIEGGAGTDLVMGHTGIDTLLGGSEADLLVGGLGADELFGDNGNDLLAGGLATANVDLKNVVAAVLQDNDLLVVIETQEMPDVLSGAPDGDDEIWGGRDNDFLIGDQGGDHAFGGWGRDVILVNQLNDLSTTHDEYVEGGPGDDFVCGAQGFDEIYGGTTDNVISGITETGLAHVLATQSGAPAFGGFTLASCTSSEVVVEVPSTESDLQGLKFNDLNANGVWDSGEALLADWTISLLDDDGNPIATATTDSAGGYAFNNLTAGNYQVVEEVRADWQQTAGGGVGLHSQAVQSTGDLYAIGGSSLYKFDEVDFEWDLVGSLNTDGLQHIAFAADGRLLAMGRGDSRVFEIDTSTGNAQLSFSTTYPADGGMVASADGLSLLVSTGSTLVEVDLSMQNASIVGSHGTLLAVLRADVNGDVYGIDGAGELLAVSTTTGVASPLPNSVDPEDVSLVGGVFNQATIAASPVGGYSFTLLPGQDVQGLDFGNAFDGATITGQKWHDVDGNGLRGTSEQGLNGWQIVLVDETGSEFDSVMTEDVDLNEDGVIDLITERGVYKFTDVPSGNYSLMEVPQVDWIQTSPTLSTTDVFALLQDDGYTQTRSDALVSSLLGGITDVEVTVDIQHPRRSDLEVYLLSPEGTSVDLFALVGGDYDDFAAITLDDQASDLIDDITSVQDATPSTVVFRPKGLLALLEGQDPNGLWTLSITDTLEEEQGRLLDWSVTVTTSGSGATTFRGGTPSPLAPGRTLSYELSVEAGQEVSRDFGNYRVAAVEGHKFLDLNGNGERDSINPDDPGSDVFEPGGHGVTIYVDLNGNGQLNRGEPNAVTSVDNPNTPQDETGSYRLAPLPPGTHAIREVLEDGQTQTFPGNNALHQVTVVSGEVVTGVDFGNVPAASVHGQKWLDENGDGVRDEHEPGINGIVIYADLNDNGMRDKDEPSAVTHSLTTTVTLAGDYNNNGIVDAADYTVWRDHLGSTEVLDADGDGNEIVDQGDYDLWKANFGRYVNPDQTTVTEDGHYWLDGVPDGAVTIREITPPGMLPTFPKMGFHELRLSLGQRIEGIDFGNASVGSVHGAKWEDVNGNGVRDPGELGVNGVSVYADLNGNGSFDPGEPSTVTMDLMSLTGDYNGDGSVDGGDFRVWRNTLGSTTQLAADGNHNGVIEFGDYEVWRAAFFASSEGGGTGNPGEFDRSGHYWLEVPPGTHVIREVTPPGTAITFPLTGFHTVTVGAGEKIEDIDFGNRPESQPGVVSGTMWFDENANREIDPDDIPISDVTVYVDLDSSNGFDSGSEPFGISGPDGTYVIFGVPVGIWQVRQIVPPALTQMLPTMPDHHLITMSSGGVIGNRDFLDSPQALPAVEPPSEGGIPPLGVVAYWGFENDLSDTASSYVQHVGAASDDLITAPTGSTVSYNPGVVGNAVTIPPNLALRTTTTGDLDLRSFTVEAFVRPEVRGFIFETVDVGSSPTTSDFRLFFDGGQVSMDLHFGGSPLQPAVAAPMSAGVWTHLAMVGEAGALTLYVNGVPSGTIVSATPIHIDPVDRIVWGDKGFSGELDKAAIWNYALTESEIAAHEMDPQSCYGLTTTVQMGEVHGTKWHDLNGDGKRDDNEPGLPGVTIYVDLNRNGAFDPDEPHAISMEDDTSTPDVNEIGEYWLLDVPPGNHVLREVVPEGFTQTFPKTLSLIGTKHNLAAISVESGLVDFGIADFGLSNYRVVSRAAAGQQPLFGIARSPVDGKLYAVTHADGQSVRGLLLSTPLQGGTPTVIGETDYFAEGDLDFDPTTGTLYGLGQSISGQGATGPELFRIDLNYDTGNNATTVEAVSSIGVLDGVLDASALAFADDGSLYAYVLTDNYISAIVPVDKTDASIGTAVVSFGDVLDTFDFAGMDFHPVTGLLHLVRGIDTIIFPTAAVPDRGLVIDVMTGNIVANVPLTVPNQEGQGVTGLEFVTDDAHRFVIDNGQVITGLDFGNSGGESSSVHGQKWNDLNSNGMRDAGENGLDGWVIELVDADGNLVATTTTMSMDIDQDGQTDPFTEQGLFWLKDVPAGTYLLGEVLKPGWVQTVPGVQPALEPGDANQDGVYDAADVMQVLAWDRSKSTDPAEWFQGDFNGDRLVDAADTQAADASGNFGQGSYFDPNVRRIEVVVDSGQTIMGLEFANFAPTPLPDGDDRIFASGDDDLVRGDNLVADPTIISVGTRRDQIQGQLGTDRLFGQEEDDVLWGADPDLDVASVALDDADLIVGGLGADEVRQTVGDDVGGSVNADQIITDSKLSILVNAIVVSEDDLFSIERAVLTGGDLENTIDASGFSGPVRLYGRDRDDVLIGGGNHDLLNGGGGSDIHSGNAGDDIYQFEPVPGGAPLEADQVAELPGQGVDTLDFSMLDTAITVDLTSSLMAQQPGGSNVREVSAVVAGQEAHFENLIGTPFGDLLTGNAAKNRITAGAGTDVVDGDAGADYIDLGGGLGESAEGGLDADTFVFEPDWGTVTLTDLGGDDTVDFSAVVVPLNFTIGSLQVTDGTNTVTHASNQLEHLVGGKHDDQFVFLDGASLPAGGSIDARAGTDELNYAAYTSSVNVNLNLGTATGSPGGVQNIENVTGGQIGDTILGDGGNNQLFGQAGSDVILGGGGNDWLFGEGDMDNLIGGSGNDLLVGGDDDDTLNGQNGSDTYRMVSTDGSDRIDDTGFLGIDVIDLAAVPDALAFVVGAPANPAHTLVNFQTSGELLRFTGTVEQILSGSGDDLATIHDGSLLAIAEVDGGEGVDTIDYTPFSTGVIVNLSKTDFEDPSLVTHPANSATGTALLTNFENARGSGFNDVIIGTNGPNRIEGGAANDTLFGLADNDVILGDTGDDSLYGGGGHDHFIIDPGLSGISIFESPGSVGGGLASGGGIDTIDFSLFPAGVTVSLPQNFEHLIGSLSGGNTLTGNDHDNLLVGGAGSDKILGGGGNDIILGHAAADWLEGGAGNDVLLGGDGPDGTGFDTFSNPRVFVGGDGRDVLVGGLGSDVVNADENGLGGSDAEDIVIAGFTSYEDAYGTPSHLSAWQEILRIWASTTRTRTLREDLIENGVGSLALGGPFLLDVGATVFDDGDLDNLTYDTIGTGSPVDDWVFDDFGDGLIAQSPPLVAVQSSDTSLFAELPSDLSSAATDAFFTETAPSAGGSEKVSGPLLGPRRKHEPMRVFGSRRPNVFEDLPSDWVTSFEDIVTAARRRWRTQNKETNTVDLRRVAEDPDPRAHAVDHILDKFADSNGQGDLLDGF